MIISYSIRNQTGSARPGKSAKSLMLWLVCTVERIEHAECGDMPTGI